MQNQLIELTWLSLDLSVLFHWVDSIPAGFVICPENKSSDKQISPNLIITMCCLSLVLLHFARGQYFRQNFPLSTQTYIFRSTMSPMYFHIDYASMPRESKTNYQISSDPALFPLESTNVDFCGIAQSKQDSLRFGNTCKILPEVLASINVTLRQLIVRDPLRGHAFA